MKINESSLDNITDSIMGIDLPDSEVIGVEILTPIVLNEKEGTFRVPVRIALKKK